MSVGPVMRGSGSVREGSYHARSAIGRRARTSGGNTRRSIHDAKRGALHLGVDRLANCAVSVPAAQEWEVVERLDGAHAYPPSEALVRIMILRT